MMQKTQENWIAQGGTAGQDGYRPAQGWLMEAYTAVLLAVFPFFNTDRYFSILSDRAGFFKGTTMLMAGALLVEEVMYMVLHLGRLHPPTDMRGRPRHQIPTESVLLGAFLLVCAVSTAMSGYAAEAWSGEAGRLHGMSMWLAYGVCFFCTVRYFRPKAQHLWLFLAVGAVTAIWGICDYIGLGLGWWLAEVKETQKHMFTSCIGNINTYTAYIAFLFALSGAYIVYAGNLMAWQRAILMGLFALFSAALTMGRSDNAVIGGITFFLVLPFSIKSTKQLGRCFWLVGVFAISVILAGILAAYTENPYMVGQDGILLMAGKSIYGKVLATITSSAAIAASICLMCHEEKILRRFRRAWAAFLATGCVLAALILLYANCLAGSGQYGATGAYLKFNDSWGTYRGLCWRLAFESYLKFPPTKKLIGSGPETFGIIMKQEHYQTMIQRCGQVFDSPHNEFIQHLFCTGILGAISYYAFLVACFFKGMRGSAIGKVAASAMFVYTAVSFVNISVPITQPYLIMLAAWCSSQGRIKEEAYA